MKKIVFFFSLIPALSFASFYSCSGPGISIELSGDPVEMKVFSNGINAMAQNIQIMEGFDTVVSGNIKNPAQTIKLAIQNFRFDKPGDRFNASLLISSAFGVKTYSGFQCIRGNE